MLCVLVLLMTINVIVFLVVGLILTSSFSPLEVPPPLLLYPTEVRLK
jgi:hypothetical protein